MPRFPTSALVFSLSLGLLGCGPGNGPTLTAAESSAGLEFLPKEAEKGTLFKYYQPAGESKWRGNWASKLDLTGVSWNDPRTVTLIAPNYVVMAAHFPRPSNVAAMFHDKGGKIHERFITAARIVPGTDISVGKLNMPLPASVKTYRFAALGDSVVGTPVIVSDQTRTLSVHRVEGIFGRSIGFGYIEGLNPIYRRNLIVGDSGHPSFILKNGELFLLETHTTGGAGAGPFYGSPDVQAAIRGIMAELGK